MNFLFFRGNRAKHPTIPTDEATTKPAHKFWRNSQFSFLTFFTSEMDKDEIEIVDESPKLPTQCELRHAMGLFNIVSIFS